MGLIVSMVLLTFIGFISTTILVKQYNVKYQNTGRSLPKQLAYIAFIFPLFILFGCFTSVNANEVGILFDQLNGGIQEATLTEGLKIKSPFQSVYKISTAVKTANFEITSQTGVESGLDDTAGGQFVKYDVLINYKINASDAGRFYQEFGTTEVSDNFILGKIRQEIQIASTKYGVFEILEGKITQVRSETLVSLTEELSKSYIEVTGFTVNDVDAGDRIEGIIIEKAESQAKIDIAQRELEAAKITMEQQKAQAENDREVAEIEAQGKAEIERITRETMVTVIENMYDAQFSSCKQELDENGNPVAGSPDFDTCVENIVSAGVLDVLSKQSIADFVLETMYYGTWNGVLPSVVAGSDGSLSFILPGSTIESTTTA